MNDTDRRPVMDRWLLLICLVGFAVRLITVLTHRNLVHPDETYQYAEQAYRVVTGRGIVPWEFSVGARSWLIPVLLVPVIAGSRAIATAPVLTLTAIAVVASLLSMIVVVSAYVVGRRSNGRHGGLFAATLTAFWCEIVYFSPHILADSLSAVPLIAAFAVGYRCQGRTARTFVAVGALLGLAVVIRPQLAPAIVIAAIGIIGRGGRLGYGAAVAGGLSVVLAYGLLDWPTWGVPFASLRTYLVVNSGGVAALFGVEGPGFYLREELDIWRWIAVPIIIAGVLGASRMPLLAVVTAAILLTFSAVGHKEYRFIFPALPLLFTSCGFGTAEAIERLIRRFPLLERRQPGLSVLVGILWMSGSLVSAAGPAMRDRFTSETGPLAALAAIDEDQAACGVGIDPKGEWHQVGSIYLRDDIGLYRIDRASLARQPAFNRIVSFGTAARAADYAAAGFVPAGCHDGNPRVCIYRRAGGCRPNPGQRLEASQPGLTPVLQKIGIKEVSRK